MLPATARPAALPPPIAVLSILPLTSNSIKNKTATTINAIRHSYN